MNSTREDEQAAKRLRDEKLKQIIVEAYLEAELLVKRGEGQDDKTSVAEEYAYHLDDAVAEKIRELARTRHAARGTFLTLALYKVQTPGQDIRMCKSEHPGGFSARAIDTSVTVPFLLKESLPRSVETHWLTQSFSFAEPWTRERVIATVPKRAGILLVDVVNSLQEVDDANVAEAARQVVVLILVELIKERNRGRVALTRPKNLTIDQTRLVLVDQLSRKYAKNGPRLAQLVVYAVYRCLFDAGINRFDGWTLEPIGRMKAADRKSGTVGDIVLSDASRPVEAVETKMGVSIGLVTVLEAMQKIATVSVERYYILSTSGIVPSEAAEIEERCGAFRQSNGCEVIVDSLLDSVIAYLRMLPSTAVFLDTYAELMEVDADLDYEHKIIWNEICATRNLV